VAVIEWSSSPKHLVRSRRHMRADDDGYVGVVVPEAGPVRIGGPTGRRVAPTRSLLVNDMGGPFECVHGPSKGVNLRVPRALLPVGSRDLERMSGVPQVGGGLPGLATSLVVELPRHLDAPDPVVGERLGGALIGVLAAMLADRALLHDGDDPVEREALRRQVRAYVDAHLGDPELCPASIAAAHHLSVRSLHKLFEDDETTISTYVRHRRLEACRQQLASPEARRRPVAAIAHHHGFVSLAHFTRVFRQTYGITPGEYRRLALAPEVRAHSQPS
jgi:AraC-like DNA-binding protein